MMKPTQVGLALVSCLLALALAQPALAQEQEVTSIAPDGTYHIYVTAKKPSYMSLSSDWEIRFYIYSGVSCYNTAPSGTDDGWWQPEGSTTWLYTGYWDYRVRNQTWTADEMTWDVYVPVIHRPAENGQNEARYPPSVGENYEDKMDELPESGQTVTLKASFLFRNLSNLQFEDGYVTFKIGTDTYRDEYTKYYDEYVLSEIQGTLSQSEVTGEWRLSFYQTKTVLIDDNAPSTGKITIPSTIDILLQIPSIPFTSSTPAIENIPATTGGTVTIYIAETNITVNILAVPPNALSENTTITVTEKTVTSPTGYTRVSKVFEVGPSGTTFSAPVTITLPYNENEIPAGVSEGELAIFRREGESWERLGGSVDTSANTISVQVNHLSEFAIMASTGEAGFPLWLPVLALVVGIAVAGVAVLLRRRRAEEWEAGLPKAPVAGPSETPAPESSG